jgi:hypothetical protein
MRSAITEIFCNVAAGESALAERSGNALGDNAKRNEAGELPQCLNIPIMLESHSGGKSPTAYPGAYVLWQSILIVRNVPTVDKHIRFYPSEC